MQIPKGWSKDILTLSIILTFPGLIYESRLKGARGAGHWARGNGKDAAPHGGGSQWEGDWRPCLNPPWLPQVAS